MKFSRVGIIIIIIIYSHTGNTGKKKKCKKKHHIHVHSVNWIIRSKTLTITQEKTVKYENKRSEINRLNCTFKRSKVYYVEHATKTKLCNFQSPHPLEMATPWGTLTPFDLERPSLAWHGKNWKEGFYRGRPSAHVTHPGSWCWGLLCCCQGYAR